MDNFEPLAAIPKQAIAGDLWVWRVNGIAAQYIDSGYLVSLSISQIDGSSVHTVQAMAGVFEISGTQTANLRGDCEYSIFARRANDGARKLILTGRIFVKPDPLSEKGSDRRTVSRRMLDAIEAKLEGRITKDAESYSIEGRSISKTPLDTLFEWRRKLQKEVAYEDARRRGVNPKGSIRFTHIGFRNG